MSEVLTEVQPGTEVPEAAIEAQAPPTPVELRYEYQPTDEQGRPLGAKQVVKYTSPDELATKLTEQNTLLIRKLREETRKNRLGLSDPEEIPDDAPRYQEPITFKPRSLNADERLRIARDLLDPEKFDEASDALFEAKMGAKPELIGQKIADLEGNMLRTRAKNECDSFVADNPDYIKCPENFMAITNWMMRYGLAPVKSNFQRAYDKLRADKVIIENYEEVPDPAPAVENHSGNVPAVEHPAPAVENHSEPAPVVENTPTSVEEHKPVTRIPTGLNRNSADDVGAPRSLGDDIVYEVVSNGQRKRLTGLSAINAMPADEYKRRVLSDPTFAKKEVQLEKEAIERKRGRIR